jgi:lysophospholipase L1-like esterase
VQRLGDPTVTALPIGAALEAPGTGALDARFTEDGVHVNPLGAERVRATL